MSKYYNPERTRGIYRPDAREPFKLSRSKIELFLECPRCFYYDRRLGVGRPPGYPFALNSAVDTLLKQEFDIHRAKGTKHPLIENYGVDARPVSHQDLENWRQNFVGVKYLHQPTNLLVFGAIDDLWENSQGEYLVVDYKATAKAESITALNRDWQEAYKRQLEIYQWLLRQNGYKVSKTGYFVYCNGRTDRRAFDGKLEFEITLIPHQGDDSWVEKIIFEIKKCLDQEKIPASNPDCDYCRYLEAVNRKNSEKKAL